MNNPFRFGISPIQNLSFRVHRDSPEVNVRGKCVPVVEGMRTVSLKPQLVAPGRERYISVGQTVLRGAAGRLGLRMFHLPGARSSLGVFDPSVVENLSGLTFADREDPNSLFIWKDKLDR